MVYFEIKPRIPLLILLLVISGAGTAAAPSLDRLSFRDQPVGDILLVLADIGGISIIPDETVRGRASYLFSTLDFDEALKAFLESCRLHASEKDGVVYVSRIDARYDDEEDSVHLHAEEVELRLLLITLSRVLGRTILFDPLPSSTQTVHISGLSPEAALEILTARLDEYELEACEDYFYIRHCPAAGAGASRRGKLLSCDDSGLFSVDLERVLFRDLIRDLFIAGEREYSLLMRGDSIIDELRFSGKDFDELLALILERVNGDYQVSGGIYYLFEIQRGDILKKLKTTVTIPLQYLQVRSLAELLPAGIASPGLMRTDKESNSVILRGSFQELGPLEEFIRSLDKPDGTDRYHRFDLENIGVEQAIRLLPPRYAMGEPKIIGNTNSFIIALTASQAAALEGVLEVIDTVPENYPVRLRFISSETLFGKLPPSVSKEDLKPTSDPNLVFFCGPEARRRRFLEHLSLIDRPAPQIRYDLLVIQYQDGESLNFSSCYENKVAEEGAQSSYLGSIGRLMTLNFDIVSNFGYLFALDLNLDISETRASVLADTTLNGLSGEDLKFQNTNTYRYRDYEIDPDTGETRSTGVTRELTSGLIITLNGWVSGDGMITMQVAATVSRQGSDSSSGNPPATTEKVVSTHVRTPSGKPVVIGGLIQQDQDRSRSRIPLLGDIPLIGRLFQNRVESTDMTEMVIYVVPRIETPETELMSRGDEAARIYRKYLASRETR
jgi:general secretion pathway protein D